MKSHQYLIVGLLSGAIAANTQAAPTPTIGWLEHVLILPQNLTLKAKIDTGADNSSIFADDVKVYDTDGKKMVKFSVANKDGVRANFDLPLLRYTTIKRKGSDCAASLKRPVVNINLCIGDSLQSVHVNLADRGNFKYRMLIGRSLLKDHYLVDSGKQFTTEPNCKSR